MSRVLVVGAGVVGLSCAIRLQDDGHHVDVLARDLPLESTSAVAAALWFPYRAYPYDRVADWSAATLRELEALAEDARTGIRLVEGMQLLRQREDTPWWATAVSGLREAGDVRRPYVAGWQLTLPVVEMPVYLRWLTDRLTAGGATITRMALASLPEVPDVVVNAAGLGARRLADDPAVYPVRGQVVHVEQFGLDRWWLDQDGPTYVVPREHDVVVGGTDQEGDWSRTPDPQTREQILHRAAALVPEITRARVLRDRVGLRPARPSVRVELERRTGDADGHVVHCYGHGGAGVTLSWGCADEVAALVRGLADG